MAHETTGESMMPAHRPVFRFAPSPNGKLHLGHALSALTNRDCAQESGGRLLVRIEDIDPARCTAAFEASILGDLEWLGLEWERPVLRQSEHWERYGRALGSLIDGGLVYPSFMSRGEVRARVAAVEADGGRWPRDPEGHPLHPTVERQLSTAKREQRIGEGANFAWRLDMAEALSRTPVLSWQEAGAGPAGETGAIAARPEAWGDVVIARKDAPTSYSLAVVVDDAFQGVTEVVRGHDLFHATSVQRLLQWLLGLPVPRYRHHRLILGPDGRKLSKSHGDAGIAALRESGATPRDIRRMVGLGDA